MFKGKKYFRILLLSLIFVFAQNNIINADVLTTMGTKPNVANNVYQVNKESYTPATNTYDDAYEGTNPTYYLVTQDASKANATSVTFEGKTFDVTGRVSVVTSTTSLASLSSVWHAGSGNSPNRTVFVDAGTYNDDTGYYQLSHPNFSIVGLDAANKPIFIRKTTGNYKPLFTSYPITERHGFNKPNVY